MKKSRMFLAVVALVIGGAFCAAAPEKADEAVSKVFRGLEQNQAQALWQALPPSYQTDVADLIHGVASNADAAAWNGAFRVLGKAVRVLDEKRQFIQQNPMVAAKMEETEGSKDAYDAFVKLLGTLTNSELADAEKMRTLDVESFMSGTVSRAMAQAQALSKLSESAAEVEGFRSAKVELVSQDGDRAVVRITGPEKSEETEMVRVEGKWIPADMAKEWKTKVEEMRQQIAQLPGQKDSTDNADLLFTMTQIESGLDTLLAAQTAEQFDGAAQAFVGMMMFRFAGAMGGQEGEEEEDPGR